MARWRAATGAWSLDGPAWLARGAQAQEAHAGCFWNLHVRAPPSMPRVWHPQSSVGGHNRQWAVDTARAHDCQSAPLLPRLRPSAVR